MSAPTEPIGTPEEQSEHRDPAPTPAEHNATFRHDYAKDYGRGEAIRDSLLSTSHGIR